MSADDSAAGQEIIRNVELALGDGSYVSVYIRGWTEAVSVIRVQRSTATVRIEGTGNAVHDVAYSAVAAAKYFPRPLRAIDTLA
jgi:hypothetical protein